MTAPTPIDPRDALAPEERELASCLSRIEAGGPSAALDARILGAARAAARPETAQRPTRPARRWPTAVGAAATLVVAVGLAWQLKPVLDFPPPLPRQVADAPAEAEVLAQAESVPAPPPPPPQAIADQAQAVPVASTPRERRARVAAQRREAVAAKAAPARPVAPADHDFVDEAIGDYDSAASAAAAAAPPPPAAEPASAQLRLAADASATAQSAEGRAAGETAAIVVTGSRIADVPVATDATLPPEEWLARIRVRRDAGDLDGARESLRRFIREHPRMRLPDDLRSLHNPPR